MLLQYPPRNITYVHSLVSVIADETRSHLLLMPTWGAEAAKHFTFPQA